MVGPVHMGTLTKDGAEVFTLNSTKKWPLPTFVFFQSCCNLELQVLQILKQARTHRETSIPWPHYLHIYISRQTNKTFLRNQLKNSGVGYRSQVSTQVIPLRDGKHMQFRVEGPGNGSTVGRIPA